MKSFKDDVELLIFADKYVGENLSRFNREINHCLKLPYAEFSAILYCFSIIDFLSSIYCGQARARAQFNKIRSSILYYSNYYTL